jgi:hypothetical protein
MSETEQATRVLPNAGNGYRMQRRALSRGVSRTTAACVHSTPGQPFFLSNGEAFRPRTHAHVARFNMAGLLASSRAVASKALGMLVPGGATRG